MAPRAQALQWWGLSLAGLVTLGLALRWAPTIYLSGDLASMNLFVQDAARGELLLGPYSRFGWHHPGPAIFYLCVPLYWLSGGKELSLHWSALLLNLFSTGVMLRVLTTQVGRIHAVLLGVLLAAFAWLNADYFTSYWNPLVAILPLLTAVVLLGSILDGQRQHMWLLVAMSSLAIQCHVGFAPIAGAVGLVAVGLMLAMRAGPTSPGSGQRWWSSAGLAALVLWVVPLVECFVRPPGNLARLFQFFTSASGGVHPSLPQSFAVVLRVIARPLSGNVYADGATVALGAWEYLFLVVWLGCVGAGLWLAVRRHRRQLVATVVLSVTCVAAMALALTRTRDAVPQLHYVSWVAFPAWTALVLCVGECLPSAFSSRMRGVLPATVVIFVALNLWDVMVRKPAASGVGRGIASEQLADALRASLRSQNQTRGYVDLSHYAWMDLAGALARLEREGLHLKVAGNWNLFGESRHSDGEEAIPHFLIADDDMAASAEPSSDMRFLAPVGGYRLYAWNHLARRGPWVTVRPSLVRSSSGQSLPELHDGHAPPPGSGWQSEGCLPVETPIVVDVPPARPLAAMRIWADHNDLWKVRCSDGRDIGTVATVLEPGIQPRILMVSPGECPRLILHPYGGDQSASLCEVAFLAGPLAPAPSGFQTLEGHRLQGDVTRISDGERVPEHANWDDGRCVQFDPEYSFVTVEVRRDLSGLCLWADHNDAWEVQASEGERWRVEPVEGFGITQRCIETSTLRAGATLTLRPVGGDGYYSLCEVEAVAP